MLRQLAQRAAATAATAAECGLPSTSGSGGAWWQHAPACWQQSAQYARSVNPKKKEEERKRQSKQQKQKGKKAGRAEGGAPGAEAAGSYEDDTALQEQDALKLVLRAIDNVTPQLDVRTDRMATKTLYIPGLMPPRKGTSLAVHWLVHAAQARQRTSKAGMAECLALELLMAYQKRGSARQKRDDLHKLALNNRANVHLRWW